MVHCWCIAGRHCCRRRRCRRRCRCKDAVIDLFLLARHGMPRQLANHFVSVIQCRQLLQPVCRTLLNRSQIFSFLRHSVSQPFRSFANALHRANSHWLIMLRRKFWNLAYF